MLGNQAQAASVAALLNPGSKANTAAATSSWTDVRAAEGDLMFVVQTGAITAGGIVYTIEHASDGSGTGAAAITPNEGAFATVVADSVQKRTVNASAVAGWVRVVGTITTGPVFVGASVAYHPKNVG